MLRIQKVFLSLTLLASASVSSSNLSAEDLSTIVVSATRSEQSTLTTASNIIVINKDDIEKSAASSVAELLRRHSGVVVSDQFGDGSRVSVGVRGFGESANANTLIMVDGRRLNNSDIATPDLKSIALIDIERIEIVYGSAGVLFGDQAVGGVINIITSPSTSDNKQLDITLGSYSRKEVAARMSGSINDDVSYKVVLDKRTADNYRDHNESDFQQAAGVLSYRYNKGSVFAEVLYTADELETPGVLFSSDVSSDRTQSLPQFSADFSDVKTNAGRMGIKHSLSNNWSIEGELTGRHNDGVFILSGTNGTQSRKIYELTPRLIGVVPLNGGEVITTVGVDFLSSDYLLSSSFGDQMNDQEIASIYAQGVVPVNPDMDITLGVRYAEVDNMLTDTGGFAIYPSGQQVKDDLTIMELGLKYRLTDQFNLFARIEENYRFAKVDEYMQPDFSGLNPVILETQTGISYELGINWNNQFTSASLSVFKLDIDDEIIFDSVSFENINLDSTSRQGININTNMMFGDDLDVGVNASYVDAKVDSGAFQDSEVPYIPEVQANIYADYSLSEKLNFLIEAEYTDERVMSGDFSNSLDKLPSYVVVNFVSGYTTNKIVYKLRINNVLDKEYSEFGLSGFNTATSLNEESFYPSPERNLTLTASIKF